MAAATLEITPEMSVIIAADNAAKPGDVIVVAALPGTGKTSLLQHLVSSNGVPSAYVMFNRKPCDEFAEYLTRGCVTTANATTFHQMAFDAVKECGIKFKMGDHLPFEIERIIKANPVMDVSTLLESRADVSQMWFRKAQNGEWPVTSDAVLHWLPTIPEMLATGVVKRFLSAKKLYVDEGQDCKPSMVRIITMAASQGASVLVAGDTNQSINDFMGACDPIGNHRRYFPGALTLSLSWNWRSHQLIANVFNGVTGERCRGRTGEAPAVRTDVVVQARTNLTIMNVMRWMKANGIQAVQRKKDGRAPREGEVEVSTVHQVGSAHPAALRAVRSFSAELCSLVF